ncbi:proline-rich protein 2-like [Suncus etruscus]|uniref:proline-rich protein 2-like n=1 Tax=Suncus etruscus TaxID=109475 RepID=UPI00210FB828|nr:proline-rich protein 2-like [Suncus etruscus]
MMTSPQKYPKGTGRGSSAHSQGYQGQHCSQPDQQSKQDKAGIQGAGARLGRRGGWRQRVARQPRPPQHPGQRRSSGGRKSEGLGRAARSQKPSSPDWTPRQPRRASDRPTVQSNPGSPGPPGPPWPPRGLPALTHTHTHPPSPRVARESTPASLRTAGGSGGVSPQTRARQRRPLRTCANSFSASPQPPRGLRPQPPSGAAPPPTEARAARSWRERPRGPQRPLQSRKSHNHSARPASLA